MFLALVPSGLATVRSLSEPWRVAHGLFALFHAAVFVWFFREIGRLGVPLLVPAYASVVVGFVVLLAEILVALGSLGSLAPLLYLIALLWFLFLATTVFIALVFPQPPPAA